MTEKILWRGVEWTDRDNERLTTYPLDPERLANTFQLGASRDSTPAYDAIAAHVPTSEEIVDALLSEDDKRTRAEWLIRRAQGQADGGSRTDKGASEPNETHLRLWFQRHGEYDSEKGGVLSAEGEDSAVRMGKYIKRLVDDEEIRPQAVICSSLPRAWQTGLLTWSAENIGPGVPYLATRTLREQGELSSTGDPVPLDPLITHIGRSDLNVERKREAAGEPTARTMVSMDTVVKITQILQEVEEAKRDSSDHSGGGTGRIDIVLAAHTLVPGNFVTRYLEADNYPCYRGWRYASIYTVDLRVRLSASSTGGPRDVSDPDWGGEMTATSIGALHLPKEGRPWAGPHDYMGGDSPPPGA